MTYLESEQSVASGKPIELYKFEGTYENYYYTSAARDIVYGVDDDNNPVKYKAAPLQRSEIAAGTDQDDGLDITIDLPVTAGVIATYGFEDAPPMLNLTIYRFHATDDVVPYWIGPVTQISTNDGLGTVTSVSELASLLGSDFPNVYYQGPCNYTLFDRRCKVVEANYTGTATLGAVNGRALSVDAIPVGASGIALDGTLIGGEVLLPSGERRMIVSQAGVVINVNFPFTRTNIGDEVTITSGCDHAYRGDCKTKFANQKNFGGFPFIGTNNPFTDGADDGSTLPDQTCLPEVFDGVYMKVTLSAPNPCNPAHTGDCYLNIPATQPNGENGVTVSQFHWDGRAGHLQIFENNNPNNRQQHGQLLAELIITNFNNWVANYYFVPAGAPAVYIKPAARYCGSVGKDEGTLSIDVHNFGSGTYSLGTKQAGGLYDIYWP